MSRYIATRALRGASLIVQEFDASLNKATQELGPDTKIGFTNTAYFLPTILGYTGMKVETIGDLKPVLEHCKTLLHAPPPGRPWMPAWQPSWPKRASWACALPMGKSPRNCPAWS